MIEKDDIFIQIIYGWLGKTLYLDPLIKVKNQLASMGYDVEDGIGWQRPDLVAKALNNSKHKKKVVIGFSMGANCITWASHYLVSEVDLAVCYDPSLGWSLMPARLDPVNKKIKRCLHFRGTGWPVGGAPLFGDSVETHRYNLNHFSIPTNGEINRLTLEALKALET